MEEVCVAGSHLRTHPLPSDRGGPHPVQLQPLPEGRRVKRMAAQSAAGPEGTLALLVGGRPQLCRSHPPRACRCGALGILIIVFWSCAGAYSLRCLLTTAQGQLQNDTQGASRDSVSEFKRTVQVLFDTEMFLLLPSSYFGKLDD